MSLSTSLNTAFSGLRAAQAGMDVVSQNVANSGTVGYTRRSLETEQFVAGGRTVGVDIQGASRTLNTLIQRQLRLEQAGGAYASTRADAHLALDRLFDKPGGTGSLASLANTFTSRLQGLANDPSSPIGRANVVAAAEDLAASLNALSGQVQALRQDAETALGSAVKRADGLLQSIAALNGKIVGAPSAALEDQRDALVDELSTLLDVKVTASPSGTIGVATTGGLQLVSGSLATRLSFDERPISPESVYDPDPAKRSVGMITATDGSGTKRDVVADGLIRSGEIAAQIELRDIVLPQAQAQLDELAAGLAASLSDRAVAGTAAAAGGASGFDLDLSALSAGNPLTVTVRDAGGTERSLTFVKATSPAGVAAAQAKGQVAIDLSGGLASAVSTIGAALGPGYGVSNPSGQTLRILNNGSTTTVRSLSAQATTTALASGSPEIPLFVDGGRAGAVFSGSFEGGSQRVGFAGRIAVNATVQNDRAALVGYAAGIPAGDTTRPLLMLDRLTRATRTFSGEAGIGGSSSAWQGSVLDFASQIIATQASDATAAANLDQGQRIVLNAIESRFSETASVNIDTELTQLIQLQTAYGANARLITAAKDMMDMLMRIGG